jgi:hypothetical protein
MTTPHLILAHSTQLLYYHESLGLRFGFIGYSLFYRKITSLWAAMSEVLVMLEKKAALQYSIQGGDNTKTRQAHSNPSSGKGLAQNVRSQKSLAQAPCSGEHTNSQSTEILGLSPGCRHQG